MPIQLDTSNASKNLPDAQLTLSEVRDLAKDAEKPRDSRGAELQIPAFQPRCDEPHFGLESPRTDTWDGHWCRNRREVP
jgi:hypothetical protein